MITDSPYYKAQVHDRVGGTPFEVKYRDMKRLEIQRSFRGFLDGYHPEHGYVVNKSFSNEVLVGETRVKGLPYWELIFEEAFPIV